MFPRTRCLVSTSRTALASGVILATFIVSLGVSVPSSSALGTSAFCKTMFTYKPVAPPSAVTTKGYRKWAKALLPFYEKLATEAPNAKTKVILNEIVTIFKAEASSKSLKGLESYIYTHHANFAKSSKALAGAIVACAK